MVKRFILLLVLFVLTTRINVLAQSSDVQVGSVPRNPQSQTGLFDYSDPAGVNIKVSVWGYARYAGKYIIPINTSVKDLLSLAGGPSADAYLDDIRLLRIKADSTQEVIKFDYNELLFEPKITKQIKDAILQPGDILVIPGEPRMYYKDYFTMTLSVVSTLISLTILIKSVVK